MNEQEVILKTREVIRRQHKALSTEESYLNWLRRYMKALHQMTAVYRDTTQGGSWNTLNDSIWWWGTDVSFDWFDVSFITRIVYQ